MGLPEGSRTQVKIESLFVGRVRAALHYASYYVTYLNKMRKAKAAGW